MRSDRLARALLALYPRAWRERYGDELLALIDDAGLTWPIAIDIVAGATAERVRALIALRYTQFDPIAQARMMASRSGRELATDALAVCALLLMTVGLLAAAGVPWPQWSWWFGMLYGPSSWGGVWHPSASRAERVGRSYYIFLEGAVFTGGLWLLAHTLTTAGVPVPPGRTAELTILVLGLCFATRLTYCGIRIASTPATWKGLHDAELRGWRYSAIVVPVSAIMGEPSGEFFWSMAFLSIFLLRTPTGSLTRLGAARQRAAYELSQQRLREQFPIQNFPADWR